VEDVLSGSPTDVAADPDVDLGTPTLVDRIKAALAA
jgi:hypothetical protein